MKSKTTDLKKTGITTAQSPIVQQEKAINRRTALRYLTAGAASLMAPPVMFSSLAGASSGTKSSDTIKLALVGGAHIHAPDFANRMANNSNVENRYVWDPNEETARARQNVAGGDIVTDPEIIFKDPEVDGVIIGSETVRHMDLIPPAVASGKHLFVEKPVGMNGGEAAQIAELINRAGLIFQTGYFMRSSSVNRTIYSLLRQGVLGDITRLRLSNVHSGAIGGWFDGEWNWMTDLEQAGIGAFGDLGCHAVDLLLWFMKNDSPVSCTAFTGTVLDRYPGCDEYGEGMVRFSSGAVATVAAGWVDHANPNQTEITGTKGHLRVTNGELFLRAAELDSDGSEAWTDLEEDLKHPLELFFDAVAGEENLPLVTADEASEVNRLITEMYNAHNSETWVQL